MKTVKKNRLEQAGWKVGSASEFLGLHSEEAEFIEVKLSLAAAVKELREKQGMTQAELAAQLGSSQSRVAKMEAGDRSVSLDLLVKSLLRIGAGSVEIARRIRRGTPVKAA
ncbi:MAG: helix-turn-helix domain-containing protein [Bryobacterales bacterium]|nr:helix-turn-helix domain-containing protein [Bryobacterales bacterium]